MPEGFKILDAYVEVHADASKVTDDAERQIRAGSGRLTSAGGGLGSALMGGMQGVIGGLVGGVVSAFAVPLVQGVNQAIGTVMDTAKTAIFDYNTTLENANIGFTTMLGSATKARSFLGELQTFAAKTPFEFSDLTLASQRLIAMGIHAKEVIPTMTAIGDAVAGLGGDKGTIDQLTTAIGQMAAKGKVQGDELMQLTEAGVPALKILADGYHVTTGQMSDMISAGKVLSDKAIPMIVRGLEKGTKTTAGFGGMMSKQSKTMAGSLSNISDSINQTLSKAFLPLFQVVEKGAGQLAKFGGSKAVSNWARDTAKNVGNLFGQLERGVKQVFGDPKVQKSMDGFGRTFSKAFKDSAPSVKEIVPNLVKFGKDVLPDVLDGFGKIAKVMPGVIHDIKSLSHDLASSGKEWGDVIGWIGDFVSGILGSLDSLDAWSRGVMKNLTDFRATIRHNFQVLLDWFGALPGRFVTFGKNVVQGLIDGITGKAADVIATAKNLADQVAGPFFKALQFGSPSKLFKKYGTWVGEGLQKGLLGTVDQIKSASSALADAVDKGAVAGIEKVTKKLETMSKARAKVLDNLKDARSNLTDLRSSRDDYRSNVRGSILDSGNIVSAYGMGATRVGASAGTLNGQTYTGSYTTSGPSGLSLVKANLKKMLSDTKKFTANLRKLVKAGIYPDLFQQLVTAGPTDGLAITNDLLANRSEFREINSLGKQVATAGNALGSYAGGVTYNGQIKAEKARIGRLSNAADTITVNMIVEAKKIDEVAKVVAMVKKLKQTSRTKAKK